jgi:hypothetical protein
VTLDVLHKEEIQELRDDMVSLKDMYHELYRQHQDLLTRVQTLEVGHEITHLAVQQTPIEDKSCCYIPVSQEVSTTSMAQLSPIVAPHADFTQPSPVAPHANFTQLLPVVSQANFTQPSLVASQANFTQPSPVAPHANFTQLLPVVSQANFTQPSLVASQANFTQPSPVA